MTKETLKALKESIAHWKRLAGGKQREGEHIGLTCCALCIRFWDHDCIGCPVRDKTGRAKCSRTPYSAVEKMRDRFGLDSEEFKAAAAKELEFLKSLLPSRKAKTPTTHKCKS